MFYLVMSMMEGHTAEESVEKLRASFLSTYLSGGAVFLPTALLTYSVIPRQHRGLFLQSVGLGTSHLWSCFARRRTWVEVGASTLRCR